ncbi:uncharacterized protein LOC131956824 [Physella acuta]|uniref:uncharacterized protein LOC131956824 n=1 Tax=Physella acuta TaxID=109671 RepID=UPI0027DBE49A|nr:uncharacterized protein LOC131956824 [Physella acuta]XP_059177409.1 uncharacterized protein LOC131956824 [Physella acuta]XP_059177410.1 uncharacterized protein LOC131956824 [Physella acuta]
MGVWRERGLTYKVGFIGVVVGSLTFIVGFCAPSWAIFKAVQYEATESMGLWQKCTEDLGVCALTVSNDDNIGWLKAVRALECIAMFFAVAACISGLYCNCIVKAQIMPDFFNKNMETSAIVSVVFGSFGLIIFATQIQNYCQDKTGEIFWGFVLVCVSNSFIGVSAFLMLISHKLHVMAQHDQFLHHHLNGPFHGQMRNSNTDAGSQVFIATSEGYLDFGPPPYESVVNCVPQDETPPPPYSQVEKLNK